VTGNIKAFLQTAHLIPEGECIALSETSSANFGMEPNRNLGWGLGGGGGRNEAAFGRMSKEHCPEFMTLELIL
jgi:hypothetical protein